MTDLLLLRHGQSTWNAEGRWQGWADAPLSPLGEEQAAEAAAHLVDAGLTATASSDLSRARRTAEIIAAALDLSHPEVEAGLRERDVGPFTGLTRDDIKSRWPEAFDPATGHLVRPPEGETDEHLLARVLPALTRLGVAFAGQRLLVISHGGVLRSLDRHFDVAAPGLGPIPNLGGRWFRVEGSAVVPGEVVVPVEPGHRTAPQSL